MNQVLVVCFFLVFVLTVKVLTEHCFTPNGKEAQCISLYKCSNFLEALVTHKEEVKNFIRQSHCGNWSNKTDPKVCCGSELNFKINLVGNSNKTTIRPPDKKVTKKRPLSDKRYCGYQHIDDYVYTGNGTGIDEFPWLAIFMYQYDSDLDDEFIQNYQAKDFYQFGCSGALINARYVITAAQCLRLRIATAVSARLGEHNIIKDIDCIKFKDLDDCGDPALNIPFEETIIHPEYNRRLGFNDIALIRLNKTVFFTDYVRPICLPTPETSLAKAGDVVVTTGFGRLSFNGNQTVIKKKIFTELITKEECANLFASTINPTRRVTDNVLCTKDLLNNTQFSCTGDSGAPLMISRRTQWHVEGIYVWANKFCGNQYPKVYTKVVNYMAWIEKSYKGW